MKIRLVTVNNQYVATVQTMRDDLDIIVFGGAYYVDTGIEWFTPKGIFHVWRQAEAEAILDRDAVVEPQDELSGSVDLELGVFVP